MSGHFSRAILSIADSLSGVREINIFGASVGKKRRSILDVPVQIGTMKKRLADSGGKLKE